MKDRVKVKTTTFLYLGFSSLICSAFWPRKSSFGN
jgi:hypothetical protein